MATEDFAPVPTTGFEAAHSGLLRALTERGYQQPTPVQGAILEVTEPHRDLLVSAQTGSGKTVAYGLALARTLLADAEKFEAAERRDGSAVPFALVVAPTRELAMQVHKELGWLFGRTQARTIACVGGIDVRQDQRSLSQGAHIVVGTPGRLCDHIDSGLLDLSSIKTVVLDEADEMLDLGFRDELERILAAMPAERQTLLFSATIPKEIAGLVKKYQREPLRIALSPKNEPHGDIEYRAYEIGPHDAEHAIVNVLRYFDVRGALAFCSTRDAVRHLHANLMERGFSAVALSGELTQNERMRALQALRDGRARVCVATDVAARGLDLPDLGLVIHAELPQSREALVHRSGRTGRAGKKGLCVVLVPHNMRRRAEKMFAAANIKPAWGPPPTATEIRERDEAKLVGEILAMAETVSDEDLAVARMLLAQRSAEELTALLVRAQRTMLPAPEELNVRPRPQSHAGARPMSATVKVTSKPASSNARFDGKPRSGDKPAFGAKPKGETGKGEAHKGGPPPFWKNKGAGKKGKKR
jgi:ATP-dependent RNA helicase DeaD